MKIKTKVAIVIPKPDLAAQTIWKILSSQSYFKESDEKFDNNPIFSFEKFPNDIKVVHSNKDGVESNHLDLDIQAELYIFASRHRAASGTPAFLIHPTGNWSIITLGGREKELSHTSAIVLKEGFRNLQTKQEIYNLSDFKVDLEVTHHGPTKLRTPLVFMELGSSESSWVNEKASLAVGEAIIETAQSFIKGVSFKGESYVGFGGNHYAYRFRKHIIENNTAFVSHIAAKHTLDYLSEEIIMEAFEKTLEETDVALIDKKGAKSPQRTRIIEILENIEKDFILV
ncbi:MAG: D-aminoacyl-tRNA deacylase [Candidatus Heimdallarchaeota archaeon]|nr:D-aminoacyl-tRNA deacylase [Candidatus Heimdallarchaeota archaeon]MCK4954011.1 D-aminoacyl-tRNA deacylase [Candidatus Heimdallarchaeota archaeon]